MNGIERRLRKLEGTGGRGRPTCWHQIVVEPHETVEQVVRREFGDAGVPEGDGLIVLQLVEPSVKQAGENVGRFLN